MHPDDKARKDAIQASKWFEDSYYKLTDVNDYLMRLSEEGNVLARDSPWVDVLKEIEQNMYEMKSAFQEAAGKVLVEYEENHDDE